MPNFEWEVGGVFIKRGGDLVQKVDVELTVDKETRLIYSVNLFILYLQEFLVWHLNCILAD